MEEETWNLFPSTETSYSPPALCAVSEYIGGSRGVPSHAPHGSRFFRFDIQHFRNVTASGVHATLRGSCPPLMGNPGSATGIRGLNVREYVPVFTYIGPDK